MKSTFLSAALVLTVCLTGCRKDEQPARESGENTQVQFVIEDQVTRTATSGGTTRFLEGDRIGIVSSGLATDMSNAIYTVSADGSLTGEPFYYDGTNAASFYAHYPATASYAASAVTMTVSEVQNTEELFNANDFMTATASGDPAVGNGVVSLRFYHRLTLVKVVWKGTETASVANMNNVKPTVTWKHADNTLTTSGDVIDVCMWKQEAAQEYWALVPEQVVSAGTDLVTVMDGTKAYRYTTAGEISFKANTVKTITLSIAADDAVEAVFSEIAIEDWGSDDVDGGGDVAEVVLPAVELITLAESQNITLTPNSKTNAAAGAWNVAVNNSNVIEWDSEESAIHMNVASVKIDSDDDGVADKETSNWWDNAVYWRPSEADAARIMPTIYKLTFKAKASAAAKGFLVQVMKGDESSNTYFGIYNADPASKETVEWQRMYYPSFKAESWDADTYYDMTYYVNFGVIIAADKTVSEGNAGDYEKVLLTLSINNGSSDANAYGVDFHFKDFSFVEVK